MVRPPGVIGVDLPPGLPDLLNDQELGFGLKDPLDLRLFVAGDDDEAITLAHDCRVSGGQDLDRLQTGGAAALAMEGQRAGDCVLLGTLLDPLVHTAEHLFVSGSPLSEVHEFDHPPPLDRTVGGSGGSAPSVGAWRPRPRRPCVEWSVAARPQTGARKETVNE